MERDVRGVDKAPVNEVGRDLQPLKGTFFSGPSRSHGSFVDQATEDIDPANA
jgi:hypothetical protein